MKNSEDMKVKQNKNERDVIFWLSASSTVLLVEWLTKACGRESMNCYCVCVEAKPSETETENGVRMVREREREEDHKKEHEWPKGSNHMPQYCLLCCHFPHFLIPFCRKHRQLLSQTLSLSSPSCLSNHSTYSQQHNPFI